MHSVVAMGSCGLGLLLLLCAAVHAAEKLPPYVSKCPSRERAQFNACVLERMRQAVAHLGSQGDKKYGLLPLDPVQFPKIETVGNGFTLRLIDVLIKTDPPLSYTVDTADFDLDRRHCEISYSAPAVEMSAKYEADGRILILPIKGHGDAVIRIEGYKGTFFCDWDEVKNEKDGLIYIKFKNTKYEADASKVIYNFSNLFNGDQTLGRATLDFLNANWRDVFAETKWSTLEASRQLMVRQIQAFFDRVPLAEALPS